LATRFQVLLGTIISLRQLISIDYGLMAAVILIYINTLAALLHVPLTTLTNVMITMSIGMILAELERIRRKSAALADGLASTDVQANGDKENM